MVDSRSIDSSGSSDDAQPPRDAESKDRVRRWFVFGRNRGERANVIGDPSSGMNGSSTAARADQYVSLLSEDMLTDFS